MVDLILTTGGTGFTLRDCMPEATRAIITAQASGVAEAIRREKFNHTPYACVSRAISGLRGRTLVIDLPGSKRAMQESLDLLHTIIPHILNSIRGEIIHCGIELRTNY